VVVIHADLQQQTEKLLEMKFVAVFVAPLARRETILVTKFEQPKSL
jgi:hypothetical protein